MTQAPGVNRMMQRIFVTFKPAYSKDACDVSRKLFAIETIIQAAQGSDISVDPHDSMAFRFLLPPDMDAKRADDVVLRLRGLQDDDGKYLLEADQGYAASMLTPTPGLSQLQA